MIEQISTVTSGAAGLTAAGPMRPIMTPGFGVAPVQDPAGFSELVSRAAGDALETLRAGEATTHAAVMGWAGTQEMVEAVMSMETSLRMTVAIRDKCVEAYQEILRMPV